MVRRIRTCPDCGQQWSQRGARFCGWCGSPLGEVAASGARRRRGASALVIATRALAVLGLGGLVVLMTSLDLSRSAPEPDPTVDLADTPEVADSPLSREEAAQLRAQADPQQLRCEPRGCELWRVTLDQGHVVNSAVLLDNGLLLMNRGMGDEAVVDEDGEERHLSGPRLVAVDPETGDEAWSFVVTRDEGGMPPWVQLLPSPDGAFVAVGTDVVSIDLDGRALWHWRPDPPDRRNGEVWIVQRHDDVVVMGLMWLGDDQNSSALVIGVDARTGTERWSRHVWQHGAVTEALLVIDTEGRLQRLDPTTGEPLWTGGDVGRGWLTQFEGWAVVHMEQGGQLLFDIDTGQQLGGFDGELYAGLYPVGDGAVGVVQTATGARPMGALPVELELVRLAADGSVAWTAVLGESDAWWECCQLDVDEDAGTLTVADPSVVRHFDLDTGELLLVESHGGDPSGDTLFTRPWQAGPGVWVDYGEDGRSLTLQTEEGEVTVRSRHHLQLVSVDPIVVGDQNHLIAVQVPATSELGRVG